MIKQSRKKWFVAFSVVFMGMLLLPACSPATASTGNSEPTQIVEQSTQVTNQMGSNQESAAPQGNPPSSEPAGSPPLGNPPTGNPGGAPPQGNPSSGGPGGVPPAGNPPSGASGNDPAGGEGGSAADGLATASGLYTLDGGTATQTGQTYAATEADQSAIYVINNAVLTLVIPTVTKTGDTSSADKSSYYGLNAGILATSRSQVTINGGTVTTNGADANGIFATGSGSAISLTNVTIHASGDGAHAVMATQGGVLMLEDVNLYTTDAHSAALATDRGGGMITMTGGQVTTSGQDSPTVYSTGTITISDATLSASGAEAAVIEGANTITLTNSSLSSSFAEKWGVMIYQSFSGDAEGSQGTFRMTGGSLSYTSTSGPLFYVTNSTGIITLKGVKVTATSGTLLQAEGNDRWGSAGSNGGIAIFTSDGQSLSGNFVADGISTITATLQNGSSFTGSINPGRTAKAISLTLDKSSTWTVTADSYLTCLDDTAGISGTTITNIIGNGNTVYYDPSVCAALKGLTYTLIGGGILQPVK